MIYLEENDLEKAEEYFEEAYSFRDWHSGSTDRLTVRMLLGLGEIALRRGDIAKATKFAEESLDISTEIDRGKFIAKSLKLKAEIKAEMGDLSEASELMEDALNLAQKMNTPRLLWQIHNSYGLLLETVGRHQEATKSYGDALALIEMTASKISDSSLRNSLLSAPLTEAIRARVPASAISRISDDDAIRSLAYRLHNIEPGNCYLSESHERCFKAYTILSMQGVPGLCILREDPQRVIENYGLKADEIMFLSSRPFKGFDALQDLQSISIALSEFLESGRGVVLLDGLEYLIMRFGFDSVYSFVQAKRFDFLEAEAVLLVPLNMETLDSREKALLSSEFNMLE